MTPVIEKEFFHITPVRNLQSIRERGLIPLIGRFAQELGETKPQVYLFASKEDMACAMSNWLGECMEEEEGVWCILRVRLPESLLKACNQEAFELQCPVQIEPQYIEVLYNDADEFKG